MKTIAGLLATLFLSATLAPGIDDVTITATRKTLDKNSSRQGGNTSVEQREIIYNVKANSRAFRELENVTIRYNIFVEEPQFGSTAKPEVRAVSGSHKIDRMITNKPVDFETDPIKLSHEKLDGRWYFKGGGERNAKDRVVGLWFRAFNAEGEQIGEFVNPPSVKTKQTWKD